MSGFSNNPSLDDLSAISVQYSRFLENIRRLAVIYKAQGYEIQTCAGTETAKANFFLIPPERRVAILLKLDDELEFLGELEKHKVPLIDQKRVVHLFMEKYRLRMPSDVIERITERSVIEVYDYTWVQRFRSANFFNVTSHSLEDIQTRPYFELFRKAPEIENTIVEKASAIMNGEVSEPMYDFLGIHKLWEINSPKKIITNLNSVVASPLWDKYTGKVGGLIHVCEVVNQVELKMILAPQLNEATV